MRFRQKDFRIVSVRIGSRIQGGKQFGYRIWYESPDGRSKSLGELYYTKASAQKAISNKVKELNRLLAQHEIRNGGNLQ